MVSREGCEGREGRTPANEGKGVGLGLIRQIGHQKSRERTKTRPAFRAFL